jgi:hypothetical protein
MYKLCCNIYIYISTNNHIWNYLGNLSAVLTINHEYKIKYEVKNTM